MTYAFGRLHGLGDMPWHESEVPGSRAMLGNPSVSVQVSSYMCSLRRRKVRQHQCLLRLLTVCLPGASW